MDVLLLPRSGGVQVLWCLLSDAGDVFMFCWWLCWCCMLYACGGVAGVAYELCWCWCWCLFSQYSQHGPDRVFINDLSNTG